MVRDDRCEIFCYDEEKVNRVQTQLADYDFDSTAMIFKAIADPNRMKIVFALVKEKELCVCDAANIIGSSTATASHHLRLMRNLGIARHRKEGKLVFYSLGHAFVERLILDVFSGEKGGDLVGTGS